jgi:hypothetical protein
MKGCRTVLGVIFLVFLGAIVLGSLVSGPSYTRPPDSTAPPSQPKPAPFIRVTVTRSVYEHGYLRVLGIAENTGTGAAYSPAIEVKVYNEKETVLLASDRSYPAGALARDFAPGARAAFEALTRVPGDPDEIMYRVGVPDFPGKVEMKTRK